VRVFYPEKEDKTVVRFFPFGESVELSRRRDTIMVSVGDQATCVFPNRRCELQCLGGAPAVRVGVYWRQRECAFELDLIVVRWRPVVGSDGPIQEP
jgi:hypothetical protein